MRRNILLLAFFIFLFISIRSVNFNGHLNFSFDQAWASTRALEIWKNKEITLVGPGSSIIVRGKQILQGSINYYFQLGFLLLGKFDPLLSSYLFMLFSALMIIPLYYGVKYLYNQRVAIFIVGLYALLPLYIDFTRFFFAPNFQFTLLPLLILFMGFYKKTFKFTYLFLVFFMVGVISQFHFATLIFLPILLAYYLFLNRYSKKDKKLPAKLAVVLISLFAFLLGFSPIIIFELKNKFYNLTVLMEYLKFARSASNFKLIPHRYLSLSIICLIFVSGYFKKHISTKLIYLIFILLFIIDLFLYLPKPKHAFGMSENWNYPLEKKAYEIIKSQNLQNFNVTNLIYDNLAVVIKYQMKKDNYQINYEDYYHNRYLFIINKNERIFNNPAYEVKSFQPHKKIDSWKLNDAYNLYLFERI